MKTNTTGLIIFIILMFSTYGCGNKLDHYSDVRDFIMDQTGESFQTTFEVTVTSDNLSIIQNYVRDIDLDIEDYQVNNIEKIEIGRYKVASDQSKRLTDTIFLPNVEKMTRVLKRSGYESMIQKNTEDEISLGLVKESRKNQPGAGYFIMINPDNFILIKVDADFQKIHKL